MTKRRIFSVMSCAVILAFAAFVMVAFAGCDNTEGELEKIEGSAGLEYELSEDGTYYTVISLGTCTDTDVVIGNWYNGLPVKGMGQMAMDTAADGYIVESITVSQGVEYFAFAAVNNWTVRRVVLPNGIETYGSAAFIHSQKLEEVVFGTGLKKIEYDTFMDAGDDVTIYFRGTEAEWAQVEIVETGNEKMANYTVVCNYKDA